MQEMWKGDWKGKDQKVFTIDIACTRPAVSRQFDTLEVSEGDYMGTHL